MFTYILMCFVYETVHFTFFTYIPKSSPRCIIAASDGVWNAIGNENAVEICNKYRETKDAQNASREIVETSRKVWEAVAKGRIDDITAVVVYI